MSNLPAHTMIIQETGDWSSFILEINPKVLLLTMIDMLKFLQGLHLSGVDFSLMLTAITIPVIL